LRITGALQAAIIALIIGFLFRHETGMTRTWPYLLAGYAVLAVVMPWLASRPARDEFNLAISGALGVLFALPVAVSAYWLTPTSYHAIGLCLWGLAGLWIVHLAVSIAFKLRAD